jgi:hypothetical protein
MLSLSKYEAVAKIFNGRFVILNEPATPALRLCLYLAKAEVLDDKATIFFGPGAAKLKYLSVKLI